VSHGKSKNPAKPFGAAVVKPPKIATVVRPAKLAPVATIAANRTLKLGKKFGK
jgi:hypothetical protein